jgi:predicted Rossmann-fold nucleotide-binding protein
LGYHDKPCGILNVDGFFDQFLQFIDHSVGQGFITKSDRDLIHIEEDPEALIKKLRV